MFESVDSWIAAAEAHAKEQAYEACVQAFKEIFDAHPGHPAALRALAAVMLDLGQTDAALSLIADSVNETEPDPETLHQLSTLLKGMGRLEESADLLICALSYDPTHQGRAEELKALLSQLGRGDDFHNYFVEPVSSASSGTSV
ncbi:MAG: tetratricopeptide repeat protein [Verrucomicrobiota bacterium]